MTKAVNTTKTFLLLAALMALLGFGGLALTGSWTGVILGLIVGGVMNFVAFFFSDTIAIKSMRGQEVTTENAPDLVEMVSRLARNANLPMPKVYICPQQGPNAFATGRSPSKAAVAVTQGALQLLDYDELEGVIGHELAHIKNRDTLISTVAATIAGAISVLGYMFMFGGRGRNVHPGLALLFIILAPIAAGVIQMAVSRAREFVADADGATIAGSSDGLIGALRKLDAVGKQVPLEGARPAQEHMFIVKPAFGIGGLSKMFSTHPPTESRIAKLQEWSLQ
jgi:heat shock protein HtpX